MFKSRLLVPVASVALVSGLWFAVPQIQAQNQPGQGQRGQQAQSDRGNRDQGANRGRRGNRQDFRQRMAQRMKEMLGATDEEWTVLKPKIEKVQTLERESRGRGMMGMMGSRRGRGGPGAQRGGQGGPGAGQANPASAAPQTPVAKASADLRTTLENKEASAADIKTKLTALRAARNKAQVDLSKAQEDLRGLLNARQEAQLVMTGLLD